MPIIVYILLTVLIIIALRNFIKLGVPIWAIMIAGAILALLFQQISFVQAVTAIDPDVMLYLFGVFVISQAAEASGYLEQITDQLFNYAGTGKQALLVIIFVLGLSSALLMNDTIAIVGTPILLQLCKMHKSLRKPLLLALAYAITTGSVLSPIGNPQNLLIAIQGGMSSPFVSFIKILALPTLINLVITYIVILWLYRETLQAAIEKPVPSLIQDLHPLRLVKISLMLMLILIITKIIMDSFHLAIHIRFSFVTILSALPILLFSNKRWDIVKHIDWGTLLFFVGTFILMQSVWDSGVFQNTIQQTHLTINHTPTILMISVLLSQFISNVPLVTLYLPLLNHYVVEEQHLLALAAGSTIAGNLTILGAASNIIILQNAEKRGEAGFSFFDFMKIGVPLTLINILVYALFI